MSGGPSIRVLVFHEGAPQQDVWACGPGDEVTIRVPGGQVTLEWTSVSSNGKVIYCHMHYHSDEQLDLATRRAKAGEIEEMLDGLVEMQVPPDVLQPIRDHLAELVPEGRG